jgi:hypothetical protein
MMAHTRQVKCSRGLNKGDWDRFLVQRAHPSPLHLPSNTLGRMLLLSLLLAARHNTGLACRDRSRSRQHNEVGK